MKTTLSKHLRRTSIFFNGLGTLSIIVSLLVAFFPQASASAGSGRIWTTKNDCGDLTQDTNEYTTWEEVYINGAGFAAGEYYWSIEGQPGSQTPAPPPRAEGTFTVDATGSFCFHAHTVQPNEGGVYQVKFGVKGDNYHVTPAGVGSIDVIKDASPASLPESGGDVTFTVTVSNTDDAIGLTLTSLVDDVFGDLNGQGTCSVPQTIAPLGSYVCSFTETLAQEAGTSHTDTVTGSGTDDNTNPLSDFDSATVTFTDVLPEISVTKSASPTSVWEPGDTVSFTVTVTNLVNEALTLNTLIDSVFGDLNGQGSCSMTQALAAEGLPGDSYTCTFTGSVYGQPGDTHTDVVTGTAQDNEGNSAVASDDATVTFDDILPSITIEKTAAPTLVPETGGPVTYSLTVTNTSAEELTLDSLIDTIYGDLNGQGTCSVPQTLAASGGTYSCSFDQTVSGYAGEVITDWIEAYASDDDGNSASDLDDASVTIQDVAPNIGIEKSASQTTIPETGGLVTFTIVVTNTGAVDIEIVALNDSLFGDLFVRGDCGDLSGVILAPGAFDTCSFSETISGVAGTSHVNTATVTGIDSEENEVTASDDATIDFTDVLPDISVTKTASPTLVSELGEMVTFTFFVSNHSTIPVTLEVLNDTIFGDLDGQGDCTLPQTLEPTGWPNDYYECSITELISGEPGTPHIDLVTATAYDDERNSDTDTDDATVNFEDVLPTIEVYKEASPSSVPETGGNVTFTVTVYNDSDETLTLNSLIDDQFGDLNGQGDCSVPQTLNPYGYPGDWYQCSFSKWLSGDAYGTHTDTVTGSATDNEGNAATDDDPATVTFTDVYPEIGVVKTADPTLVDETGGDVTYSVTVTNYSDEALTLTSLIDDVYGDLDGNGTCAVPQTLAPFLDSGYQYSCTFTEFVSGPAGTDVIDWVEAIAWDDDDNSATASDDATVTIQDVQPNIQVEKTADPTVVPESGADVTFTITVTNIGPVTLWLTGLTDTIFGDLNGMGSCDLTGYPELDPGEQYICSFTEYIAGDEGEPHTNIVTATGEDADDNEVTDEDPATVDFTDILPEILVTKSPSTTVVYAPGGNVTFTVTIVNQTAEPVTIDSLVDSVFGDLNGKGTCAVPQDLAASGEAGDTYQCSFTSYIAGVAGAVHSNIVTANGYDDDQNRVSDDSGARVRILNIVTPPPYIPVTGVDLAQNELPLSSLAFASLGMVFFGLGFATKGYADRREEDES